MAARRSRCGVDGLGLGLGLGLGTGSIRAGAGTLAFLIGPQSPSSIAASNSRQARAASAISVSAIASSILSAITNGSVGSQTGSGGSFFVFQSERFTECAAA